MDMDDPGVALLALINSYVANGVPRDRAQRMAMARYPSVADAWDRGELIPSLAERQREHLQAAMGIRRLAPGEEPREGEYRLERMSDPAAGGGSFAMVA